MNSPKGTKTLISRDNLELEVDFTMEWDERGFTINCEVLNGNEHFGEHLIPSMTIHYIRGLCRELGLSFESVLRASMGVQGHSMYREKVEA